MGLTARHVAAALMLLAIAAIPAAAQSVSPKPRSSGTAGIEVRTDVLASGALHGDGGGSSARSAASQGNDQQQTGGPSASAAERHDGAVRIDGNTTSNATGADVNASSVGRGNSGCNNVGSISGRGC